MGEVLNFKDKVQSKDYADALVKLGQDSKGKVTGGVCIVVTDEAVHVICGPNLDGAMAALSKLTAIMSSVYTNNLAQQ